MERVIGKELWETYTFSFDCHRTFIFPDAGCREVEEHPVNSAQVVNARGEKNNGSKEG